MVCFGCIPCDSVIIARDGPPPEPPAPLKADEDAMQLRQLLSGRWLVRVSYMQDGQQKELSKTFARKREAEQWQRAMEADRDRGTLHRLTRLTVGEYLTRWLRDLTGVGGRTREDYTNLVRRYLTPALGTRRLAG